MSSCILFGMGGKLMGLFVVGLADFSRCSQVFYRRRGVSSDVFFDVALDLFSDRHDGIIRVVTLDVVRTDLTGHY